ncbi:type VI toxin-antitoxin system SocB family DNA replication inhibitor toxin [Pseudooceanicola sp.]|uniref:type VI toxin-antitoxin system SocB family DNA replication inhibitor toxin n=1 Tax=Pseudooceanicola sp. TaxID=1914328 RepID=UPI0040591103
MKIPPLPDIDLARIAPQPTDMKRKSLLAMRMGHPPFSYRPVRLCFTDIFDVQSDLLGPTGKTPWEVIASKVARLSRSEKELTANLRVARGLHDFASREGIEGRAFEIYPFPMGAAGKVTYWQPLVLAIDGRPLVPFVEPRSVKGLGPDGRRFAFSIMHERIRVDNPDLAEVRLGIIRFGSPAEDRRAAVLHTADDVSLYPLDELQMMVASTYDIWREVCEEREFEARRKATGTDGGLF